MDLDPPPHSPLRQALERAGWRCTRQREVVFDHLSRMADRHEHPTAEDVYQAVRPELPSISLATVYKAPEALVASGLVTKIASADGSSRFDARSEDHYHLRCLKTGTVEDLPTAFDPDLIAKLDPALGESLRLRGFRITGYRLELVGFTTIPRGGRVMDDPSTITLIDTHAHLASPKIRDRIDEVLARATEAGVVAIVAIATDAADSPSVIELAERYPAVHAAVGIHPNECAEIKEGDWDRILELATRPAVVAIGETGLDRYWGRVPFPLQIEWFDRHLDLAQSLDLPVVIHSRDCQDDVIERLSRRGGPVRGIQHSFTGTWEQAAALIGMGLHISFAGMLTFENRTLDPLRDVASRLPADRILVETDSPYLTPHPFRGKPNEPARVRLTAETLARVRRVSLESVAATTTENARVLFRRPA